MDDEMLIRNLVEVMQIRLHFALCLSAKHSETLLAGVKVVVASVEIMRRQEV